MVRVNPSGKQAPSTEPLSTVQGENGFGNEPVPLKSGISTCLEWTGTGLSILCVIHCLAMPLLLTLPLAGPLAALTGSTTESVLLVVALGAVALRTWRGYQTHHRILVWGLLAGACLLIVAGKWIGGGPWEPGLLVPGALSLPLLVFLNRWFCSRCRVCGDHSTDHTVSFSSGSSP